MSTLTDIKFDLLKIDLAKDHTQFLSQMSGLLDDLGNQLTGSWITSVDVPSIQTSYQIAYGAVSSFNVINIIATVPNPTLNYYSG